MQHNDTKDATIMERAVEGCKQIALLIFRLSRVNRSAFHEDGRTPESDTDHTVMLGITACAFASRFIPQLDIGKIAQYALAHELVEAYAGDTMTLKVLTNEEKREKQSRESAALQRIASELHDVFPWIVDTIKEYEALTTPEARYVKAFDKHMGALTGLLNGGVAIRSLTGTKENLTRIYQAQSVSVAGYASDLPKLLELREQILREVMDIV